MLYVNVDEEKSSYKFAFLGTFEGDIKIANYSFHKRTIDAMSGLTEISVDKFFEVLNGVKSRGAFVLGSPIIGEYSTLTATPEQKEQFDAMTKNIFAELDIAGLDEKNVKFGFKTPRGGTTASAGNGWLYATVWEHYYVVELKGELKLIKCDLSASTVKDNLGPIDQVIKNTSYWGASSEIIADLQKGNETLYIDEEKEATLTR